jgi:hypothetical protein
MAKTRKELHHASDEIQHIKEDLDSLRSNVVALTRAVRSDVTAEAITSIGLIKEVGRQGIEHVEEQIRVRPAQSLLAAFTAGLALSFLARR